MKKIFTNIKNVIVCHSAVAIVITSAIIITAVAVPVGVLMSSSGSDFDNKTGSVNSVSSKKKTTEDENESLIISDTDGSATTTSEQDNTSDLSDKSESIVASTPSQAETSKPQTPSSTTSVTVSDATPSTENKQTGSAPSSVVTQDGVTVNIPQTEKEKEEAALAAGNELIEGLPTECNCENCGRLIGDGHNGTCNPRTTIVTENGHTQFKFICCYDY